MIYSSKVWDTYVTGDMTVTVKTINLQEFSKVSMQTFEEQRIFALVNRSN